MIHRIWEINTLSTEMADVYIRKVVVVDSDTETNGSISTDQLEYNVENVEPRGIFFFVQARLLRLVSFQTQQYGADG